MLRYILAVSCVLGLPLVLVGEPIEAQEAPKPNIILIMTDDQTIESMQHLSRLKTLMTDEGVSFTNAFVTTPLCCPSRVSILRGQYSHNHGVISNKPPSGGHARFLELGLGESTVATWLRRSGYKTVFVGKYLNGYWGKYVSPGWASWHAYLGPYHLGDYKINHNGILKTYNTEVQHDTDVFASLATKHIRTSEQPLFLAFWTNAPHGPAPSPARHESMFEAAPLPRGPSFNEEDVSDKPEWVKSKPPLTDEQIASMERIYRLKLRSMLSVEDAIKRMIEALKSVGEMDNTYIIFTSDNGFHMGEHRLNLGKQTVYEEDIRVPLMVRGPGVPGGETREHVALNIDLAPMIASLAGAGKTHHVDGRSLDKLFTDPPPPERWREDFLVEAWPPETQTVAPYMPPAYSALRTGDDLYVEYADGDEELYDLLEDPYQLHSIHESADPALLASYSARLAELKGCASDSCRTIANPAP
jgi:arylsulfatase A-like enzyme